MSHAEADIELSSGASAAKPAEVYAKDYRTLTEALNAAPPEAVVVDEHGCRATADGAGGYRDVECARTGNSCDCFYLATRNNYNDEDEGGTDPEISAADEHRHLARKADQGGVRELRAFRSFYVKREFRGGSVGLGRGGTGSRRPVAHAAFLLRVVA
jgi:hypothetical protein